MADNKEQFNQSSQKDSGSAEQAQVDGHLPNGFTVTSEDKMEDEANLKPHLINTFFPEPISFN